MDEYEEFAEETKHIWEWSCEDVCKRFGIDPIQGLSFDRMVEQRNKYGTNELEMKAEVKFFKVLISEIKEPMMILLLVVGIMYSIWGKWSDALFIFIVIFITIFLEVQNEYRAKRAVESLSQQIPRNCQVIRDGMLKTIPNSQVVIHDLIVLHCGQFVPADCRLIESHKLLIDESLLTGESVPVQKDATSIVTERALISNQCNMAFAGTTVVHGKGKGIVTALIPQKKSQIGKIVELLKKGSKSDKKTPVQVALKKLAKYLSIAAIIISVLIPLIAVLRKSSWKDAILAGLSLAFATIPEELPILIKAVLALGSLRLAKNNLLMKNLHAAETIGTITMILTDKTGTLTYNQLKLSHVTCGRNKLDVRDHDDKKFQENSGKFRHLLEGWAFCLDENSQKTRAVPGDVDPFASAVWTSVKGTVLMTVMDDVMNKVNNGLVLKEIPFDSKNKITSKRIAMSGSECTYLKGAPEVLLGRSEYFMENEEQYILDEHNRKILSTQIDELAKDGLRVIGVAKTNLNKEDVQSDLIFIGLFAFEDEVRKEVAESMDNFRKCGIKVVMVTGDHVMTASAVARKVGIVDEEPTVLEGNSIDELSEGELKEKLNRINVVARATPEHKFKLVQKYQEMGEVVLVMGDGMNDAPALRIADVGVAMGRTGTDMAKEAASIILLDDNFSTIQMGIEESRKLSENLRKSLVFYLACKLALVALFFISIVAGFSFPLAPVQVILLEMFMDLGASTTFIAEVGETDLMDGSSRRKKFLDRPFILRIMAGSASLLICVFGCFLIGKPWENIELSRSLAFAGWLWGHLFLAFHSRTTNYPVFKHGFLTNKIIFIWITAVMVTMILVLYVPYLKDLMKLISLNFWQLSATFAIGLGSTIWFEAWKAFRYFRFKERRKYSSLVV